jgi:ribonuclease HI
MGNSVYNIWSDGSFREGKSGPTAGAGWVVEHEGIHASGSRRLAPIPREAKAYGSDIAELQAVTLALSFANVQPGSIVRLRMDCQNVIDWLETGRMKSKNQPTFLENSFAQALNAMAGLERLEIIKASDRNNSNMKKANDLARTAAKANFPSKNL